MNNIKPIWGDEFKNNLYNSKIALNLSQGKPLKYYSSDRIAQLMGNGIATIIDKKTKLDDLFPKDSAIFYNSLDDLNIKLNKPIPKESNRVVLNTPVFDKRKSGYDRTNILKKIKETKP